MTAATLTPRLADDCQRGSHSLQRLVRRPIRFTVEDANNCGWCFNCGPGALCAVLNLTPDEVRPLMGDFESKGYTNPTLMLDVLNRAGAKYRQVYRSDDPKGRIPKIQHGLMRVQWGGPWTKPGVPMRVRYRHTHWVALRNDNAEVFDVNATCVGGWMKATEWEWQLIPWLIKECVPKGDGTWWPTHALEVTPNALRELPPPSSSASTTDAIGG